MVKRKLHIGIFLHHEMAISVAGISPMCGCPSMPRQKIFFLRSIALGMGLVGLVLALAQHALLTQTETAGAERRGSGEE